MYRQIFIFFLLLTGSSLSFLCAQETVPEESITVRFGQFEDTSLDGQLAQWLDGCKTVLQEKIAAHELITIKENAPWVISVMGIDRNESVLLLATIKDEQNDTFSETVRFTAKKDSMKTSLETFTDQIIDRLIQRSRGERPAAYTVTEDSESDDGSVDFMIGVGGTGAFPPAYYDSTSDLKPGGGGEMDFYIVFEMSDYFSGMLGITTGVTYFAQGDPDFFTLCYDFAGSVMANIKERVGGLPLFRIGLKIGGLVFDETGPGAMFNQVMMYYSFDVQFGFSLDKDEKISLVIAPSFQLGGYWEMEDVFNTRYFAFKVGVFIYFQI